MQCKVSSKFISRKIYFALFKGFKTSDYEMLLESYLIKIYSHYTLEQPRFKRGFVLMNQKSRQNAKNAIEKDFFKLMNTANFGFDCRNSAINAKFDPIIDEVKEITSMKSITIFSKIKFLIL